MDAEPEVPHYSQRVPLAAAPLATPLPAQVWPCQPPVMTNWQRGQNWVRGTVTLCVGVAVPLRIDSMDFHLQLTEQNLLDSGSLCNLGHCGVLSSGVQWAQDIT